VPKVEVWLRSICFIKQLKFSARFAQKFIAKVLREALINKVPCLQLVRVSVLKHELRGLGKE